MTCALAPAVASADDQLPNLDLRGAQVARDAEAAKVAPGDGLLTARSTASPESIALSYVRAHETTFGLDDADVDTLHLAAEAVSPDGITHLRFDQVVDGVESYDAGLTAHVTRDGRLIEITGHAVPGASLDTTRASVGATASLGAARDAVHGSGLAPGLTASSHDSAEFTTGETAQLQWTDTAKDGVRLAWSVVANGNAHNMYNVLVDAGSGAVLARTSITDDLGQALHYTNNPDAHVQVQDQMPAAWYDDNNGGTRLWGMYARTYADYNGADPAAGAEGDAALTQVPASGSSNGGPDWLYTVSHSFPGDTNCPASGCTWNSADHSTKSINMFQAATNAHFLVSNYHDYLQQAPIGFDEASGNFQRVNAPGSGVGGDYVQVEVDDSAGWASPNLDNANFATPPDGTPGRMQMYLWDTKDVNGADEADVVYHEYGHGLSNRLLVNAGGGSGITGLQSEMMGEAWSDFYALDYLQSQGLITDTSAPGEVTLGSYVTGDPLGIRAKPIDCPVDPSGATSRCNRYVSGHPSVRGGYTYGDITGTDNSSPHNGGEVWAETLWDLRAAVGRNVALTLVTGGLRLSPVNPTMLDMRDAILREAVAIRSAPGASDDYYDDVWSVFAARGFGGNAVSANADSASVTESYAVPTGLRSGGAAVISDPYPGGDGDGVPEAGETVQISQPLTGVAIADESGVTGALSATGGGGTVVDGSATWPLLGYGRTAANTAPMTVKLPSTCATPATFSLAATAPSSGPALTTPISIDTRPGTQVPVAIHDNQDVSSSFTAYGSGTITDANIRITALQHSYLGDLHMTVTHDGVSARLLTGYGAWDAQDLNNVVFDDSASGRLNESTGAASPSAGHYRSDADPLAVFNGHPIAGTWTLTIHDDYTGDTGVLRSWGVDSPQIACSPGVVPTAATTSASASGEGMARLVGSVNPAGHPTSLRFAWGTTTGYGNVTAAQDAGSGTDPVSKSVDLTMSGDGLVAGVTYHVRTEAVAAGGAVVAVGEDRTFSVSGGLPPAPPSTTTTTTPLTTTPAPSPAPEPLRFTGKPKVSVARKASHRRRAATLSFALSGSGRVSIQLTRATRCTSKKQRGKTCYVKVGAARPVSIKDTKSLRVKLGSLPKGRYIIKVTVTGTAGVSATVSFTVR